MGPWLRRIARGRIYVRETLLSVWCTFQIIYLSIPHFSLLPTNFSLSMYILPFCKSQFFNVLVIKHSKENNWREKGLIWLTMPIYCCRVATAIGAVENSSHYKSSTESKGWVPVWWCSASFLFVLQSKMPYTRKCIAQREDGWFYNKPILQRYYQSKL